MFRLNRMLFLQPLPEPNGENWSEKSHTAIRHSAELSASNCLLSKCHTRGGLCELLHVPPLLQQQAQRCLTHRCPGRSSGRREEVGVVLRNEAGAHVSHLKLRVTRKAQQELYVSVESYDRRTEAQRTVEPRVYEVLHFHFMTCTASWSVSYIVLP